MAKTINEVTLLGRLTRDPDLRATKTGQNVANIALVINKSSKNEKGEWEEKPEYFDIVAWGQQAENAGKFLAKGRRALVRGYLQPQSWEKDGQKHNKLQIVASDITYLDAAEKPSPSASSSYQAKPKTDSQDFDLSEIPF